MALIVTSAFALIAKEWKVIKLIVIIEMIWLITGIISNIINYYYVEFADPIALGVLIFLLALFLIVFLKQEDKN